MLNIYDLSAEIRQIEEAIDDPDMTDDRLDELLKIQEEDKESLRNKVLYYGEWVLEINGGITAIDNEIKRLQARKKSRDNLQKRIKDTLNRILQTQDFKKVEDDILTVRLQKKTVRLEVVEEEKIPDQFRKIQLKFKPGVLDIETFMDLQSEFGKGMEKSEEIAQKELNDWFRETGEVVSGTQVKDNEFSVIIK